MPDTSEKILDLLSKALPKMSEAEKERLLWFGEGVLAAVQCGQDSA